MLHPQPRSNIWAAFKEMLMELSDGVSWTGWLARFLREMAYGDGGGRQKSHETSDNKLRKESGLSLYGIPHRQIKSHLRSSLGQSFLCDVIHTFPKEVTIPGQMFKQLADKVQWNENPCWDVNSYLSLCQEH